MTQGPMDRQIAQRCISDPTIVCSITSSWESSPMGQANAIIKSTPRHYRRIALDFFERIQAPP